MLVDGGLLGFEPPQLFGCGRVFIIGDIPLSDAGEDRLQREVVLLRNGIEFVGMAAGAICRGADKCGHGLRHQVVAVEILKVGRGSGGRAAVVIARSEKTQRRRERGLLRKENIGGELLADEAVPRRVPIETSNHIVAEAPGVRPEVVVLKAVGVGKMNRVQPMARPALAIARRGQQLIH